MDSRSTELKLQGHKPRLVPEASTQIPTRVRGESRPTLRSDQEWVPTSSGAGLQVTRERSPVFSALHWSKARQHNMSLDYSDLGRTSSKLSLEAAQWWLPKWQQNLEKKSASLTWQVWAGHTLAPHTCASSFLHKHLRKGQHGISRSC